MKLKLSKTVALILISALCLAGCTFVLSPVELTTDQEESTTAQPPEPTETEPASGEISTEPTTEPTAEITSSQELVTDFTAPSDIVLPETTTLPVSGEFTQKGFEIVTENGMTHIDGVLVVNKTYSLPESYNPGDLLPECALAFAQMKSDAKAQGLSLTNSSGFRSFSRQSGLYAKYCARDGVAAADRYSARPGYSEHQTGLAIDLNSIAYSFADTPEGIWVDENCWKYGFILRYPEGKEEQTGYRYEPWHIRYVGKEVAEKIYASGLCLEEYYGITSQYADLL